MSIGFGGAEPPEEELEEEEEFHELDEDSGNSNNNKHRTSQDSFQSDIQQKTSNSLTPTSLSTPSPQHQQKIPSNSTTTTTIQPSFSTSSTIDTNQINVMNTSDNNLSDSKSSSNKDQTPSLVTPSTSPESDKDLEQPETSSNDLSSELHKLTLKDDAFSVDQLQNDTDTKSINGSQDNVHLEKNVCEAKLSEEIVSIELERVLNENASHDLQENIENVEVNADNCVKQESPLITLDGKTEPLDNNEPQTNCQIAESNPSQEYTQSKQDSTEALHEDTNPSEPSIDDHSKTQNLNSSQAESCLKVDLDAGLIGRLTPKSADWADIMLSDNKDHDDESNETPQVAGENSTSKVSEENVEIKEDEKKQLDLDEDVKQPQYIPKKGVFYEHDDRTADSAEKKQLSSSRKQLQSQQHDDNSTENKDSTNNPKKTINSDRQNENRKGNRRQRSDNDRWDHDRYKYDQQKPKNRSDGNEFSQDNHRPDRQSRNQLDRSNRNNNSNINNNSNKTNTGSNGPVGDRNQMSNQDGSRNRTGQRGGGDRAQRQNQLSHHLHQHINDRRTERMNNDRRPRRQIPLRTRNDSAGTQIKPQPRDQPQPQRSNRADSKDYIKQNDQQVIEQTNSKQNVQNRPLSSGRGASSQRRDQNNDGAKINKINRSRRQESVATADNTTTSAPSVSGSGSGSASTSSSAKPLEDEKKSPPINTVMPPMTTWSNKMGDMVADDVSRATDPSPGRQNNSSNSSKSRSNDGWPVTNQHANKSNNHNRDQANLTTTTLSSTTTPATGPHHHQQQQHHQQQHYGNNMRNKNRDDGIKQAGQYHNSNNRNNNYGDRSNQQQHHYHSNEWRRTGQYGSRLNDYEPIKTQTFENSRLSHGVNNMGRGHIRDAREILNEKRGIPNSTQHQSFHHQQQQQQSNKMLPSANLDQHNPRPNQHLLNRQGSQQMSPRPHPGGPGINPYQSHHSSNNQQLLHQHSQANHQIQQLNPHQHPHQQSPHNNNNNPHSRLQNNNSNNNNNNAPGAHPAGQTARLPQQQLPQSQQPLAQQQQQQHHHHQQQQQQQQQQNVHTSINDPSGVQENSSRINTVTSVAGAGNVSNTTNSGDMISTRPIVKADAYGASNIANNHVQQHHQHQHHHTQHHHPQHHMHHHHQHQQTQHSQNPRPLGSGAPLAGQPAGPTTPAAAAAAAAVANAQLMGHQQQHIDSNGAQYYPATSTGAAAALGAYHGYIPSGHSVIDSTRYHLTSQQHMAEHGYLAASQHVHSDVGGPAMYNDATAAGGTVASSAYLAAQAAGSGLSPSTNPPVTGAGGPPPSMGPVSYMQHSQYPPPPYTNPYSQPPQQPNQAPPPQSSHAYQYWTYI